MLPPTLGTIMHFGKLAAMAEGKTGLDYVVAKLRELNMRYCWTPGLRNKPQTDWGQVNRHLWRIQALYFGGDCFLASWPGASPHQRLYPNRSLPGWRHPLERSNQPQLFNGAKTMNIDHAALKAACLTRNEYKAEGLESIISYDLARLAAKDRGFDLCVNIDIDPRPTNPVRPS